MRVAKLVEFGRGGDCVLYDACSRCSGYGTPERPHAAAGKVIPDGTYAIDKRAAVETEEGFRWVFAGPMCNPDLPDDACDACPQPSIVLEGAMTSDPSNQFGQLLSLQAAQRAAGVKRGSLDHVSISEYVAGWRAHGARIGRYQGGVIVWEG